MTDQGSTQDFIKISKYHFSLIAERQLGRDKGRHKGAAKDGCYGRLLGLPDEPKEEF